MRLHHLALSCKCLMSASAAMATQPLMSVPSIEPALVPATVVGAAFDSSPLLPHDELAAMLTAATPAPSEEIVFANSAVAASTLGASSAASREDDWIFGINLAIWLPGVDGDVTVRGFSTHVNESFLDILDQTDSLIGFTGMLRVTKGKIGGYFGGSYNRMGVDFGEFDRDNLIMTVTIASFGISYEAARWAMPNKDSGPSRDAVLLLTAGGRYTGLKLEADFDIAADRRESKSWVDPMIGAAVSVPLGQHFSIVGGGEIGGFGVSSDFAWGASIALSWDFYLGGCPSSLQLGYLAIGDKYEDGSGDDRFEWNTIMHGLLLNFNIQF